jgi:hypothetical protein
VKNRNGKNEQPRSFEASENSLSPLSLLHKWRGEALRKSEVKAEISFEELKYEIK